MQDIPPNYATLFVATCNLLNLANPHRMYYENQDTYAEREYERKIDWTGERFRALNADVLAVQEVRDENALKAAIARSGLRYDFVAVPGAENTPPLNGAQGTPRVGACDKAARDVALFNACEMQGESALKKDVAYSHIHQGYPDVLDQILVSEEFIATSRHSLGDVRRVDYFNGHLHEGRDRSRSDHGFVRALLRLRTS
jgi:hypothetical protein